MTFIRHFLIFTAIASALALAFISCEKDDTDMEAVIEVRYLGDTARAVPNAYVKLEKNAIMEDGFTDANGIFRHVFKLEMILDVTATIDTGQVLLGTSVIRLRPGKSVKRTVYLSQ